MPALLKVLDQSGGPEAGREHSARLRALLTIELQHGARELEATRSGYAEPVLVAFAAGEAGLATVCPAEDDLRADPAVTTERGWLVVAAAVGALVAATEAEAPAGGRRPSSASLVAGRLGRWLVLTLPAATGTAATTDAPELAALHFDERMTGVDRLRARAVVIPGHVIEAVDDPRPLVAVTHPLCIAELVARLGGDPSDPASVDAHEEAVLALLGPSAEGPRAHHDPDPVRRVARRILQRLDGMGKWGGYHTEFVHLTRGFAPAQRPLAAEIGERLLAAGLLAEKTSVGQRHVFLNPRRSGDIKRLIESGDVPRDLALPGPARAESG